MHRLAFALAALAATFAAPTLARADGPPGACGCTVTAVAPPSRGLSIGVHATSMTLDDQVHYGGGGLLLAYRFGPRWEVELTTDHVEDAAKVAPAIEGGAIAARFHLTPRSRWDLYLLAGAGGIKEGDQQSGLGELGGGVERRFGHFGIAADLRAIAIGAPKDAPTAAAMSTSAPTMTTSPQRGGGQLDLALAYHF